MIIKRDRYIFLINSRGAQRYVGFWSWLLIGWAGKLQSHGYDKISRAYVANQSARKTLSTALAYILNTNIVFPILNMFYYNVLVAFIHLYTNKSVRNLQSTIVPNLQSLMLLSVPTPLPISFVSSSSSPDRTARLSLWCFCNRNCQLGDFCLIPFVITNGIRIFISTWCQCVDYTPIIIITREY